jgi:hypothetical protein
MIIMEAILSASALLHGRAAQSVGRSVRDTLYSGAVLQGKAARRIA